jgi:hypothetical protein
MSTGHHRSGLRHASHASHASHANRAKFWLRSAVLTAVIAACSVGAHAGAIITVNSLLDDVFPDAAGAISVPLTAPKCTLRMAIASANLDLPVGGATFGCAASTSPSVTSYNGGGADYIVFDAALVNGTIMLDATQAMDVGTVINNTGSILFITGPVAIESTLASRITIDGGSTSTTTSKRILAIAEAAPSATDSRAGSSIWVSLLKLNFQNARVESAGGCVLSYENIRMFDVSFTNCVSTNTPTVATGAGGALFVRAPDTNGLTFRPDVRLTRVSFKGNKALAGGNTSNPGGGAFYLGSGSGRMGNVVLTDVTVGGPNLADQNYADGSAGGGYITSAESVSIASSTFQGNVAQNTEAGGLRVGSTNGPVTITGSSFLANQAKTTYGGLRIVSATGAVTLRDLTITGNTAQNVAGVGISGALSNLVFSNSMIASNTAISGSGGLSIQSTSGTAALDDLTIANNRVNAGSEGGFSIGYNTGSVKMRRAQVSGNQVFKGSTTFGGSNGAGGFYGNTSLTVTDSVFSGNASDRATAALRIYASFDAFDAAGVTLPVADLPPTTNAVTFDRVTISGNSTNGVAGVSFAMIYLRSPGIYTFVNTTITGNTVTGSCGGAFSADAFNPSAQTNAMQIIFRNSTLARNSATQCQDVGGFGAYFPTAPSGHDVINGSLVFESSILGGRQPTSNPVDLIFVSDPSKVTMTNTLIENNGDSLSGKCGMSGNLCNTDAKLEPLASNGGPTQTLRLLAGSPAINAGSNVTGQPTDQRGAARLQGVAVDMGAYETPAGSAVACNLDMDGDSLLSPTKEGLVLVRAMLGFNATNIMAGTGLAASWATIRASLNANCGTNFP